MQQELCVLLVTFSTRAEPAAAWQGRTVLFTWSRAHAAPSTSSCQALCLLLHFSLSLSLLRIRIADPRVQTLDPYRVRTTSGALLSLASLFLILTLTLAEFASYRRIAEDVALEVDRSRGEKLAVKIDVTFPRVPCYREFLCGGSEKGEDRGHEEGIAVCRLRPTGAAPVAAEATVLASRSLCELKS